MKRLTDKVDVGGQISVDDIAGLSERGIRTIINNRPDHEGPFQVESDVLAAEAAKHDIAYFHIPMSGGVSPDMIAASIEAYSTAEGKVAAFCKSGTRSTALWCFAHVTDIGINAVLSTAQSAGYNLGQLQAPLNAYLEQSSKS